MTNDKQLRQVVPQEKVNTTDTTDSIKVCPQDLAAKFKSSSIFLNIYTINRRLQYIAAIVQTTIKLKLKQINILRIISPPSAPESCGQLRLTIMVLFFLIFSYF